VLEELNEGDYLKKEKCVTLMNDIPFELLGETP